MLHIKIITCFTLLLVYTHSYSQNLNRENYKQQAEKAAEGMRGGLQLTEAQTKEVKAIEERFFIELLAPDRDSAQLEARDMKIKRLQMQKEAALQKVLSLDQWKQYEAYLAIQRKKQLEAMEERRRKAQEKQSSNG